MDSEFYVGYLPKAPSGIARVLRLTVVCLVAASAVIAGLLIAGQLPFPAAMFAYGEDRNYSGQIEAKPYPALVTANARYLLVGSGKHGAGAMLDGADGRTAELQGSLIARDQRLMLEVLPASLRLGPLSMPAGSMPAAPTRVGPVRLSGEIVDSKCYLGVMNPGEGKVHRDCAARCISGGIPPGFVVRDENGKARVLLLIGSDGRPLGREIVQHVAQRVEISGVLYREHGELMLWAEPSDMRRE